MSEITREEVNAIIEDARAKKKNKADHVRTVLESREPGIAQRTIMRNGHEYNLLDYLLGDVESYGTQTR